MDIVNRSDHRRRDRLSARYVRLRDAIGLDQIADGLEASRLDREHSRDGEWEFGWGYHDHDLRDTGAPTQAQLAWEWANDRLWSASPFSSVPLGRSPDPDQDEHEFPTGQGLEAQLLDYLECLHMTEDRARSKGRLLVPWLEAKPQLERDLDDLQRRLPVAAISLIALLATLRPFWIRRPGSFRGATAVEMVEHLLCRFPVPPALSSPWRGPTVIDRRWCAWLIVLGQGGSLRRLSQAAAARGLPGWWPIPKKFTGCFARVPSGLEPEQAIMYAEVLRAGGSAQEYRLLCRDPSYRIRRAQISARDFGFWTACVRWLVEHGSALALYNVSRVLAWARHEHTERVRRGRGAFEWGAYDSNTAVLAAFASTAPWYERLDARRRPVRNLSWPIRGWNWTVTMHGSTWEFRECIGSAALRAESAAMSHCVRSYDGKCHRGESAIVSLLRDGERSLTIEVRLGRLKVVQALGAFNRAATPMQREVVRAWEQAVVAQPAQAVAS